MAGEGDRVGERAGRGSKLVQRGYLHDPGLPGRHGRWDNFDVFK